MSEISYIFSIFCHQSIERSPHYAADIFPLCFRCAGIYLGIFSTYLSLLISRKYLRAPSSMKEILFLSILFLPLMIDGAGNALGMWNSASLVRSITGLSAGIFLATVMIPYISFNKFRNIFSYRLSAGSFILPFTFGLILISLLYFPINIFVLNLLSFLALLGLILLMMNLFVFWKYYNPTVIKNNI